MPSGTSNRPIAWEYMNEESKACKFTVMTLEGAIGVIQHHDIPYICVHCGGKDKYVLRCQGGTRRASVNLV